MKSLWIHLAISIIILSATSCSTTYRVHQIASLDEFIGCTHNEIVERLGAPSGEVSDGSDGYILIYKGCKSIFSYPGGYVNAAGDSPTAEFFMTGDGECRRVITSNTDNARAHSPGKTVALVLLLLLIPIL